MGELTSNQLDATTRVLAKIAYDSADGTLSSAAYDNVHDECVSVLKTLAKAGHKRSQELLNPPKPATAQDAQPELARSGESIAVGSIGL